MQGAIVSICTIKTCMPVLLSRVSTHNHVFAFVPLARNCVCVCASSLADSIRTNCKCMSVLSSRVCIRAVSKCIACKACCRFM